MIGNSMYDCHVQRWLAVVVVVGTLAGTVGYTAPADDKDRTMRSGTGIGQEMKDLENEILKPTISPRPSKPDITIEPNKADTNKVDAVPAVPEKNGYKITTLEVRGDLDFLKKSGLFEEIRAKTEGQILTDSEIQGLVRQFNGKLVKKGYYVASIWTVPADYAKGTLILGVDQGRIGKKAFYARGTASSTGAVTVVSKKPYAGKYYSENQLRRRLDALKEGEAFEYASFYTAVYNVNALPDVTMDTDLKVRKELAAGRTERFVDMDFAVEERFPMHVAFSVGNSGTKATGDWRPSMTIQHLNLTHHDDVLSLNLGPISPNAKDLKSFAASYYLPNDLGHGGASTLYAGYSDLDAKGVVEGVDVQGQGWFIGGQESYRLVVNERHLLSASLGLAYRFMEDRLILTDPGEEDWALDARQVRLVPISLSFSYSSGRADAIGGRNFLTSQTTAHSAGFLGASDEEEIQTLRVNADGDYFIERLQGARLQPLSGASRGGLGWLLFVKADGQLASGPLIPAEQKAIGGADTVRGFPERIAQGDDGVSGTIELRTPLMSTFLGSPYKTPAERTKALNEGRTTDRLQFVLFTDAGMVKIQDSLTARDQYTMTSAGVGFRLALTKYSQMRFDWGVPLSGRDEVATPSEEISSGGRYHFSAQVQF